MNLTVSKEFWKQADEVRAAAFKASQHAPKYSDYIKSVELLNILRYPAQTIPINTAAVIVDAIAESKAIQHKYRDIKHFRHLHIGLQMHLHLLYGMVL